MRASKSWAVLLAVFFQFGLAVAVRAAIISTTGAVSVATPPADVSSNHWESDTVIRAFAEQQGLVLLQPASVDISLPGTSPSATDQNLSPAVIPAGTLVNVYSLHFDVVGTRPTNSALEAIGSITFSQDVLGLIALSGTLNNSNATLGLPGLTYSSGPDHGLELNPVGGGTSDFVTFSADRRTVNVDLLNASFADDLRIVTAVPEPSVGLIVVAAASALLVRRRGCGGWQPHWDAVAKLDTSNLHHLEFGLTETLRSSVRSSRPFQGAPGARKGR
jgi:hypothetical protein